MAMSRYENVLLFSIDTIISVPQYSVFQNYSSYTEYPWLLTGKFAYERFEIRLQFKVSGDVLQDGLMVYLGQNEIGMNCFLFTTGFAPGKTVKPCKLRSILQLFLFALLFCSGK